MHEPVKNGTDLEVEEAGGIEGGSVIVTCTAPFFGPEDITKYYELFHFNPYTTHNVLWEERSNMATTRGRKILGHLDPKDFRTPPTEQTIWKDLQPMVQSILADHEKYPDHEYAIWVKMKGQRKLVKIQDVKL